MTCSQCQDTGKISVPYPPPCRGSHIDPCPCQYAAIIATAMMVPAVQELVERFIALAQDAYQENYAGVNGSYADAPDGMFEDHYSVVEPFLPYYTK